MFSYHVSHCRTSGRRDDMQEMSYANSHDSKYGERSEKDVKSPPHRLGEFPVICFHTSMIY